MKRTRGISKRRRVRTRRQHVISSKRSSSKRSSRKLRSRKLRSRGLKGG